MVERITHTQARRLLSEATENDKAISIKNVGANPWFYRTPYRNNRGVKVNMWSCISYYFEAMPEATMLNYPHIVKPWDHDYPVRVFTDEWLVSKLAGRYENRVSLEPVDESPFANNFLGWDHD